MIRLRNVSKYYYSKGIIASGISKVNLDLDVGEFVVITGESGSGKSTLLNVISGLDTYEEGEMYIEGHETSHYAASDFEAYRRKYISCIFQSFNLINSYTVYQNVALAMQIDGCEHSVIKSRVRELLGKVGLSEFENRKVSKLSGGQKQRVAIARALARDTKILVADEPTGNLDSESAEGIVELLTEIAADRLVVVVTHNFEQFKDRATRVIKMHDGKIVEDTYTGRHLHASAASSQEHAADDEPKRRHMSYAAQLGLGIRNTFNLPAKFLLLLLVFLFVTSSVSAQYVSVKKQRDTVSEQGTNFYFSNYDPKRIVIERSDHQPFTRADYEAIEKAPHVDKLVRNDMIYDSSVYFDSDDLPFNGYISDVKCMSRKPDLGRMPEADNEIVLEGADDGWMLGENPEAVIGKSYKMSTDGSSDAEYEVVVAGIIKDKDKSSEDSSDSEGFYDTSGVGTAYLPDALISKIRTDMYAAAGTTTLVVDGNEEEVVPGEGGLVVNSNVPEGYILLPTSYDSMFDKGYAAGNLTKLSSKTLYYGESLELMIMGTYGEKTFTKKTGLKDLSEHNGEIYINETDFRRLYEKGSYQASVFVDDTRNINGMKDMLERGGFEVLVLRDHIYNFIDTALIDIIQLPMAVLVSIAVFFIAYFVIRLILKSRGVYFATVRMLGMDRPSVQRIMRIELMLESMIAYAVFLLFIYLSRIRVIHSDQLSDYIKYLSPRDYVILAGILLVMALLISGRFMRSIFKSSAMGAYREEA